MAGQASDVVQFWREAEPDQFPRNAFRGSSRMYETDAKAREVARAALAAGHPDRIAAGLRTFFHLPFSHSEDLADQDLAVSLQATLGRTTTPDEQAFLDQGGFSG